MRGEGEEEPLERNLECSSTRGRTDSRPGLCSNPIPLLVLTTSLRTHGRSGRLLSTNLLWSK